MIKIKKFPGTWVAVTFLMTAILLISCQPASQPEQADTPAPTEAATPTKEPTVTPTETPEPAPTDTPAPTATATATPTPDLEATDAAMMTQTSEAVLAIVEEELENIGVSLEEGHLAWFMNEPESITVNTFNTLEYSVLDSDLNASNFVIHSDITWDSTGGLAICGIIMRSVEDIEQGAHYRFQTIRLSGMPSWDVERYEYGEWQTTASNIIVDSPSIDQENGATNKFTVIANNEKFTVFVNDDRPKNVVENALKEGIFAFMTWQDTGETTCTFSNAWVWTFD